MCTACSVLVITVPGGETDLFDVVYFHDADRIAREVISRQSSSKRY
jgi:hypothetical protein